VKSVSEQPGKQRRERSEFLGGDIMLLPPFSPATNSISAVGGKRGGGGGVGGGGRNGGESVTFCENTKPFWEKEG